MSNLTRRIDNLEQATGSGAAVVIVCYCGEPTTEKDARALADAERLGKSVIIVDYTGNINPAEL